MAKYKAYPKYKDSGVEWLGEIPKHWNILLGKRLFDSVRTYAFKSDEQLAASQKYGVIPQSLMMQLNDSKVMLALKGTDSFRHVEKNNFVISLRSFEGGIEYSNYSGCVSPAYTVLKNAKPISYSYYQYVFKCTPFISALQASTDSLRDGKSINYEQFGAIYLPFTSTLEQNAIADYLVNETIKIDNLIEKQLQLIELLKEKRQAVISHAVTKGLNPDVPMKDSGVEWLGDIPSHWNRTTLKRLSSLTTGLTPPTHIEAYYAEEGHPWIRPEDLNEHGLYTYATKYVSDTGWSLLRHIKPNSTLVCCIGTIGKCGYIGETVSTNQQITAVTFHNSGRFYFYLLKASRTQLEELASGNVLKILNSERLGALSVVKVNNKEAISIAKFLDHETAKIDTLIQKQLQQIELLKERRTALISAAVTGKIDLRDWTPPASSTEASLTAEEATA